MIRQISLAHLTVRDTTPPELVTMAVAKGFAAGMMVKTNLKPPRNTHIQNAFLLSCRKLGEFFSNQSGKDDVKSRDYFRMNARPKLRLPEWRTWKKPMDGQLALMLASRILDRGTGPEMASYSESSAEPGSSFASN